VNSVTRRCDWPRPVRAQRIIHSGHPPIEVSASHAYEALRDAFARAENELTRKEIYQISDRFQWTLFPLPAIAA
jgi:hypothetical protein